MMSPVVGMQPVHMPVTPLARAMHRFLKQELAAPTLVGASADEVGSIGGLGNGSVPVVAKPAPTPPSRAVTLERALSKAEKGKGLRSQDVLGGLPEDLYVTSLQSMNDGVARYRSVDEKGRVWGAPSAFGAGQCVDCPGKAKGNTFRCVECQKKMASRRYPAMAAGDVQLLRDAVDELMKREHPEKREAIARRLDILFGKLAACKIEPDVQGKLLQVSSAMHKGERDAVSQQLSLLASQDWRAHKAWIIGLCQLSSHATARK